MKFARRLLLATFVAILAGVPALGEAQGRYGHGGHHGGGWGAWGPGPVWGGVALGLDLALMSSYYYGPRVWYSQPVIVLPAPSPVYEVAAVSPAARPSAPDPIIYPRNGQTPEQTEVDRQGCNTWATTQPRAMADASVFRRATEACMDGRGYTLR